MAEVKSSACCMCGRVLGTEGGLAGCPDGHLLCANCHHVWQRAYGKLLEFDREISDNNPDMICPDLACKQMLKELDGGGPRTVPLSELVGKSRSVQIFRLKPTDIEFQTIADKFGKTLSMEYLTTMFGKSSDKMLIQELYRIDNPPLKAIFEACKARIEREGRRMGGASVGANEALLFHATDRAACGAIMREGFDMRRSGKVNGQVYGPGAYFAADAAVSHGYSRMDGRNQRCMLLCRVILGDASGRDSTMAPGNVFVVNREQQILPTYMIIYSDPEARAASAKSAKRLPASADKTPAAVVKPSTAKAAVADKTIVADKALKRVAEQKKAGGEQKKS